MQYKVFSNSMLGRTVGELETGDLGVVTGQRYNDSDTIWVKWYTGRSKDRELSIRLSEVKFYDSFEEQKKSTPTHITIDGISYRLIEEQ